MAWIDNVESWVEYGNPHSFMGQGEFLNIAADVLIEGKAVFDWISDAEMVEVTPFNEFGVGLCNPCGPFEIQPTDTGSFPEGSKLGIQLYTSTFNQ